MATYRYSKYDKDKKNDNWLKKLSKSARQKISSLGRKPLNLKMSDYYSRKPKQAKSKRLLELSHNLGDKLFIIIAISILVAFLVAFINWGINDTESFVLWAEGVGKAVGDLLLWCLLGLAAYGGIWVVYQCFKWNSQCPSCKAPWQRQLIDKTFLGTYDTRYDSETGSIKHRNRYLEKYQCGNCGYTWNSQTSDWF